MGDLISSMTQEGRQGQDVCTIILGGEYRGIRMPEWLPRRFKGVGDTSERVGCGAYQVAKFFQSISSVRHSIIRKLEREDSIPRRADARRGRVSPE